MIIDNKSLFIDVQYNGVAPVFVVVDRLPKDARSEWQVVVHATGEASHQQGVYHHSKQLTFDWHTNIVPNDDNNIFGVLTFSVSKFNKCFNCIIDEILFFLKTNLLKYHL